MYSYLIDPSIRPLSPRPVELHARLGQQLGQAAPRDLRVLHRRDLDPVAAAVTLRHRRLEFSQMAGDQLADLTRKRPRLLLDIDHPQRSLAIRLALQALAEPAVDNFEASHRVASGRI